MLKEYYSLVKPGIVYGNAITALAGFFVGVHSVSDLYLLLPMVIGISCIVAAGCVFNNIIDRDIDAKMTRTQNRPIVRGTISLHDAYALGILFSVLGAAALYFTNLLTIAIALFGLFIYVIVYSKWCKRYTLHATVIGAISGAVPPVVGYTALSNSLDLTALILFLVLFTWQMPHALAIAIKRIEEYRAAGIPVMPIVRGFKAAVWQMVFYGVAFFLSTLALGFTRYPGTLFALILGTCAAAWLALGIYGFWAPDEKKWATRMFLVSLIIILVFFFLTALLALLSLHY